MNEVDKRINSVILKFLFKNRFYFEILQRINKIYSDEIEKIGIYIDRYTINLIINPNFIKISSDDYIRAYLEHEILHILFYHPIRRKLKNYKIFDLACDLAINQYIENLPIDFITINKLFSDFKVEKFREAEYYYYILKEIDKSSNLDLELLKVSDDHKKWSEEIQNYDVDNFLNKESLIFDTAKTELLDRIIEDSYNSSHGKISSEVLKSYVEKIVINKKEIGLENKWKIILKKLIKKYIYRFSYKKFKPLLTKKRPNKKLGYPFPILKMTPDLNNNIFVVVDSSGSITGSDFIKNIKDKNSSYFRYFEVFLEELNLLVKEQININLAFCDENVLNPYNIVDYDLDNEILINLRNKILYLIDKINLRNNGIIYDYNYKKKDYLLNLLNYIIEFNSVSVNFSIRGIGGGTSFVKAVDLAKNQTPKPSCIIYFTDNKDDGKLTNPNIPIIFISTEIPERKYNFADYILIKF